MVKFFTGKFGRDAGKEFIRKIHHDRLSGDLKISSKMEKQIEERFVKVFAKNGKVPLKVRQRDIEKEILNPLRIKNNDYFSSKNIDAVDKGFGFTEHTKQLGGKYAYILQQEKKAELKKHFADLKAVKEKIIEANKEQKPPEVKNLPDSSRLDEFRKKREEAALEEEKRREAMESKYGKKDKEPSAPSQGRFSGKGSEYKKEEEPKERGISNPMAEYHEGTPSRESLQETHIGPIKPPSEVGG